MTTCAAADGLMIVRYRVTAADFARFPKLRAVCRMGVGYDSDRSQGGGGAPGDGAERAGLRHHRGRRPRDVAGAGAAARAAAAP